MAATDEDTEMQESEAGWDEWGYAWLEWFRYTLEAE